MAAAITLLGMTAVHAEYRGRVLRHETELRSRMVDELGLSDLCLFTEARYTRHPSVTDLFTPFQDHPFSQEHFPSGSLMAPPEHIIRLAGERQAAP